MNPWIQVLVAIPIAIFLGYLIMMSVAWVLDYLVLHLFHYDLFPFGLFFTKESFMLYGLFMLIKILIGGVK